jgi:hypothetical protein
MHKPIQHSVALLLLAALTTAWLAGCGGGSDGPAIRAIGQSVRFAAAPTLPLRGSASVAATASSNLPVTYSSTTPTVCTVGTSTGLVSSLTAGTCSIAADQSGDDTFAPAPQATQSLVVKVNPAQTIQFGAAASLSVYGTVTVPAIASSGLAVRYSSLTPGSCTVNPDTGAVTGIATGTCTVAADQAGDSSYNAAPQALLTLLVAQAGPAEPPGVPTDVKAVLGNASNTVLISFGGPASGGGSPVAGYSVASIPAGITASGSASPIAISCPLGCSGYSFTVAASNSAGMGLPSASVDVMTRYQVKATFFEPDTQPNDTLFTGSFTLNSTRQTVSGLSGLLTESMTGPPMITVPLTYQLSTVSDGPGGLLVTSFALNTTNTFAEGGFAAGSEGMYYGWPTAKHPGVPGGVGNAYVTIYVNVANPLATLTPAQINRLAYADCAPGGMMGDTCMTGYWGRGTMGGYPVAQTITQP